MFIDTYIYIYMPYTVHIHNWWVKSPEKIHIRVAFPGDYVSFEAFIFQGRLQGVETLIGKTWKDVGLYQNWWFWQEHVDVGQNGRPMWDHRC